ncbi:MAG: DCC1-like thiol-disulfide oxidoreductase family protein [bacterium]
MDANRKIVIFDGICNLCNAGVNFVIKRDPTGVFSFTPMQSDISQKLIKQYHAAAFDFDTFLLIKNGVCYERSDAIMEIMKDLTGYWSILRFFSFVPKPIRDYFYNLVARNRYQLFGKRNHCMVPTQDIRKRFIES